MFSLGLMAAGFVSATLNFAITPHQQRASCWINDVVVTKNGVRIYFRRKGGPLFVNLSDRIFIPSAAPVDPARPEEAAVEVSLGDRLYPANSHHDGCSLVVSTGTDKLAWKRKQL